VGTSSYQQVGGVLLGHGRLGQVGQDAVTVVIEHDFSIHGNGFSSMAVYDSNRTLIDSDRRHFALFCKEIATKPEASSLPELLSADQRAQAEEIPGTFWALLDACFPTALLADWRHEEGDHRACRKDPNAPDFSCLAQEPLRAGILGIGIETLAQIVH
jgi:hypothetical protein